MRKRWLWETLAPGVVIIAAALAFWLGQQRGLDTLHIQRITPDQAATAMAHDEFYSDYNEATLLIRGSVASVNINGGTATVGFATVGTVAQCQMNQPPSAIKVGATVTMVTEGSQAQRLPNGGVLLRDCIPIVPFARGQA
jgi:hypothetical protein